ncbi:unnamed protein product, partial [Clonostachys byssicola]
NDLWAAALQTIGDEVRTQIDVTQGNRLKTVDELLGATQRARERLANKSLSFKRKNGEIVFVRDLLARAAKWVNHFKDVGDIIVQYDPNHLALPWAGVRFLLNVAIGDLNTYASVLEGITKVTELLCRNALLERLLEVPKSKTAEELSRALVKLYASILTYFAKACSYYQQSRFKSFIKNGLFASHDLESALENIDEAQRDVDRSATIFGLQEHLESHAELKRMIREFDVPINRWDKALHSMTDHLNGKFLLTWPDLAIANLSGERRVKILCWISDEPFEKFHIQANKEVLEGTGNWLLREPAFARWKRESASSILWLHGIPGSGKSKLTSIVIKDALAAFQGGHAPAPAYFYCSRNPAEPGRSDASKIMASIARQLSAPSPSGPLLKPAIEKYAEKEAHGFASGPLCLDESKKLILDLLEQYNGAPATVVIDALDECSSESRGDLLCVLEDLLAASPCLMKIFVSSREDQDIVYKLAKYPNLHLSSDCNSIDIDFFIRAETQRLVDENSLRLGDREDELRKRIIYELTTKAQGMFRWASLQLRALCQQTTCEAIEERLGRLPATLAELHKEILTRIENFEADADRQFARNALSWLLCAREQLTSDVFLAAVSAKEHGSSSTISKDQLLQLCCNLVIYDTSADSFRFSHLSVREFLEQQGTYDSASVNAVVARVCISSLDSTALDAPIHARLLDYSTVFWAEHASTAASHQTEMSKILRHFLFGANFNSWHTAVKELLDARIVDRDGRITPRLGATISHWPQVLHVVCTYGIPGVVSREEWMELAKKQPRNTEGETHLEVAARWGSCSILQWQLDNEIPFEVTEKMIEKAVENSENGKDILALLLNHGGDVIEITDEIVERAVRNERSGKAIMELLLDKRENEVQVSSRALAEIAKNSESGKQILSMFFKRGMFKRPITEEMVSTVVKHFDEVVLRQLIGAQTVGIKFPDKLVETAAENSRSGGRIMMLLLEMRSIGDSISKRGVEFIARKFDHTVFRLLYEKRGSEIPIKEGIIIAAAENKDNGDEILQLLLRERGNEIQITERIAIVIARNSSPAIFRYLLDSPLHTIGITQEVVEAAAENKRSGDKILELLFYERGDEIKITEGMAIAIARNSSPAIFRHLLDNPVHTIRITHEVVKAAAQNRGYGKEVLELLLNKMRHKIKITDEVLAAAAANYGSGRDILTLLLTLRGEEIIITEKVIMKAILNVGRSEEILQLLLDKGGNEAVITSRHIEVAALLGAKTNILYGTETLKLLLDKQQNEFTIAEKVIEKVLIRLSRGYGSREAVLELLLTKSGCDFPLTEGVVESIARHCRCSTFQLLLNKLDNEIPDIQNAIEAAAENENSGQQIVQLLLDKRGHEIIVTEKMIKAAARNSTYGKEILELLFEKRGDEMQITDEVLVAAARNSYTGREVMKLLLRRSRDNMSITDQVVTKAAANEGCGDRILELLLDREGAKLLVTEKAIAKAIRNLLRGKSILVLLLGTLGDEISITEEFIEHQASTFRGGEKILEIILSKPGRRIRMTASVVESLGFSMFPREFRQFFIARRDEFKVTNELIAGALRVWGGKKVIPLLLSKQEHEIKITETMMVQAAEQYDDGGKELLMFLFQKHGKDAEITNKIVTAAAGNSGSGKEILELLLDQRGEEFMITEEAILTAARNPRGKEILVMLLSRKGEWVRITDVVVAAAAGNSESGKEILELLLKHRGDEITITEEVVIAAAGNSASGEEILKLLLEHRGDEFMITQEVVIAAAGNSASGEEILKLLLKKQGGRGHITDNMVTAAAGNSHSGKEILEILLGHQGDEIMITQDAVVAAAGNPGGPKILKLFVERSGVDLTITENVLTAAAGNHLSGKKVLELFFSRDQREIQITVDVAKAIAENIGSGKEILEWLLDKQDNEAIIKNEVVEAAIAGYDGEKILDMLLKYGRRWETQVSERILKTTAQRFGPKIIRELLNMRAGIPITAEVVEAAIGNQQHSKEALTVLLNNQQTELQMTSEVMAAAAGHWKHGDEHVKRLFESGYGMGFPITDEILEAAVRNEDRGMKVMELLLDRRENEIRVTAAVVKAAARNRQSGAAIIKLLFDKLGGNFPITIAILNAASPGTGPCIREVDYAVLRLLHERLWSDTSVMVQVLKEAFGNRSITDKVLVLLYLWVMVFASLYGHLYRFWRKMI